jgi:hypothetical protein
LDLFPARFGEGPSTRWRGPDRAGNAIQRGAAMASTFVRHLLHACEFPASRGRR